MTDPTLTLNRGQAARAAMLFGNAQVLLQAGHAFGQNIVTGFGEVPTRDLDPIYIRMAGIEAAFLMDGASYAWDSNGLVVSADLSLSGVTGYTGASAPSSSWVRLPVPSAGLNPTPVPDTDVTIKANSIAIPAGFNPRDPASVAAALAALPTNGSDRYAVSQPDDLQLIIPVLESESFEVMTGGFISAIEYEYALTLPAETFSLATGGVVVEFAGGVSPAAAVTVAGLAPIVSTGASVAVPAAAVMVAAVTPSLQIADSVEPPAAVIVVAGVVPVVEAGTVIVNVPAGVVTVAAMDPAVIIGAGVAVPVAAVSMGTAAPTIEAGTVIVNAPVRVVSVGAPVPRIVLIPPGFAVPDVEMGLTAEPLGFGIDVEPLGTAATDALQMVVPEVEML